MTATRFSSSWTRRETWYGRNAIGGTGWECGLSLALDGAGNIWSTGYYMGPLDFDPGPGIFELPTLQAGELDAFVLKLDPDGDFLWAGAMGGTSQDLGTDILVDHGGNRPGGAQFSLRCGRRSGAGRLPGDRGHHRGRGGGEAGPRRHTHLGQGHGWQPPRPPL